MPPFPPPTVAGIVMGTRRLATFGCWDGDGDGVVVLAVGGGAGANWGRTGTGAKRSF